MKKPVPVRKARLALDTTTLRRLDDTELTRAQGAGAAMRSIYLDDSCSCFCHFTQGV